MARRKAPDDDEQRRRPLEPRNNVWVRDRQDGWERRQWLVRVLKTTATWAAGGMVGLIAFRDAITDLLKWVGTWFSSGGSS